MIVKCSSCQTRFKIPDQKVTDKGVKVRCTRCQNTFRVTRADAQPSTATGSMPAAARPAQDADPFARFGPAPDPEHMMTTRPFEVPNELRASGTLAPSYEAQQDVPPEVFDQPTRIGPLPLPPSAFGPVGTAPSTAPPAIPPAPAFDPFNFVDDAPPAPPAIAPAPVAPRPPPAPSGDPFDFLDAEPPTRPMARPPKPSDVPQPQPQARPPSAPPPVQRARPAPAAEVPPPRSRPAQPPPPPPPPAPAADPFALPPEPELGAPGDGGLLGDVPALSSEPPAAAADPFAASDPFARGDPFAASAPTGEDEHLGTPLGGGERAALFDMPERPPAPPPPQAAEAPPDLAAPPPPSTVVEGARSPEAPSEAAAGQARADKKKASGAVRRVAGVFANLALALLILAAVFLTGLVYLNEGKVELSSFEPARLGAMLSSSSSFSTADVSNGLYDTSAGRPIFYVRGEVRNRGPRPAKVKVRAQILDGSSLVRDAEVFAGASPTPEELYGLQSAADVEALAARLEKQSASVAPGAAAPFLITFYEFPPDLTGYRLKVVVTEVAAETAAR